MSKQECPSRQDLQAFAMGRLTTQFSISVLHILPANVRHAWKRSNVLRSRGNVAAHRSESDAFKAMVRTAREFYGATAVPTGSSIERSADPQVTDVWRSTQTVETGTEPDSKYSAAMGDYEILSEIAKGGMGIVYRATHRQLRRHVALKMILPNRQQNPDAVERFLREAQAAARLWIARQFL